MKNRTFIYGFFLLIIGATASAINIIDLSKAESAGSIAYCIAGLILNLILSYIGLKKIYKVIL